MSDDLNADRDHLIRDRAYAIWLDEGRPNGRADEHWRMACEAIDAEEAAVTPLSLDQEAPPLVPPNR